MLPRPSARLGGLLLLGAALLLSVGSARAADPREDALAAHLALLEDLAWNLDRERPWPGSPETRVGNLHVRLARIEAGLRIPTGAVSRRSDLASLLSDALSLGARVKGIRAAQALARAGGRRGLVQPEFVKSPPPPAPPGPPPGAPPEKPVPGAWPKRISFAATAKIGYWPEGEWFLTKMRRSGWGPDFLLTGWKGDVSFSLRARDLVRQVRSCELRVAVRLPPPFATVDGTWRLYDVAWKPDVSMANTSLRTWMGHERLEVAGPFAWVDAPRDGSAKCEVECWVRQVTLLDKSVVTFEVPEFLALR